MSSVRRRSFRVIPAVNSLQHHIFFVRLLYRLNKCHYTPNPAICKYQIVKNITKIRSFQTSTRESFLYQGCWNIPFLFHQTAIQNLNYETKELRCSYLFRYRIFYHPKEASFYGKTALLTGEFVLYGV